MATVLYRLGLWTYARPWRVIVAWVLLLAAIGGAALGLGGTLKNAFSIPRTESQEALDRLEQVFPQTAGASIQIVFQAPEGDSVQDEPYTTAITDTIAAVTEVDGVAAATDPFSEYATDAISEDGRVGIGQVTLTDQQDDVSDETIAAIEATALIGRDAGMQVEFAGSVLQDTAVGVSPIEGLGVIFAGIVLVFTFGSFLAAGMPLAVALLAVGISSLGVLAAAAFAPVSSATPLLGLMVGLAVGIDYSLFIISRHRNQLATGSDPRESAGTAVATAGSAVVFAGVTVIIALLGLLIVGIPFLAVMGVSAAVAVALAVLAAITLLPALLGLAKGRLTPKTGSRAHRRALAVLAEGTPEEKNFRPTMGARWVRLVTRIPLIPIVLVIGLLGAFIVPALSLQLALPDNGGEPTSTTQRKAYDIVADEFGAGRNGPLVVLVDITQTTDIFDDLDAIAAELEDLDDVAAVGPGVPNETVDTAIIQVIPEEGPSDPSTTALVERIRALAPSIADQYGTPIQVTGATAVAADISSTLGGALVPFAAIVVGLSVILLMMVFRSLFVPITAALGFVLSVVAAFGAVVLVFQDGYGASLFGATPGPILSFMPILLIAIVFGLAMDYQVFLVSGMREVYVHTRDARSAVTQGFTHAARVVTAAALIMFFVFFSFVPEGIALLKPIALGLAVGVVVDAFLVRMTLIPALMALAGPAAWYLPKWLERILPNVDIEGESLTEHRDGAEWASGQSGMVLSTEGLQTQASLSPVDITLISGAMALLVGEIPERRSLLATLAGRQHPIGGHAQVLGYALPTEAGAVSRRVALLEVEPHLAEEMTVGELLREQIEFASPWYRLGGRRGAVGHYVDRVNRALAGENCPPIDERELFSLLPLEARAGVAVALGMAGGASVLALDLVDAEGEQLSRVLRLIDTIAPSQTTLLIGTGLNVPISLRSGRPALPVRLSRKAVLS
ncbi:MMPL family transporter [Naasia lichenicola]|uniref:MMPL family transporter n=1 Tax=Naasia lichenicola TaxID=2565933 RepID=A0A4S4FN25_9MICO|nr:MMPL family transporter [Naasia lichenicola]THG31839.1 MMPL family transporter [Naasia lichenicola]